MTRDYHDIVGGLLLIAAGLFVASYAYGHYDIGSVRRMGPGMFPMGAGAILAVLGVFVALPAVFRRSDGWRPLYLRPAAAVCLGVISFALMVRPFGLVPAILVLNVVSSLAVRKPRPLQIAVTGIALCVVAYLIFHLALHLPLTLFRWPW
ncbi:tripartite tricarboxylate transporter TctB family protein [Lutibaculum baratangense]|nr:tripartite tricarboxylate transporter TctB family protein [Lutibaculum baratangense]